MLITQATIGCKSATVKQLPDGKTEVELIDPVTQDLIMGFEVDEIVDHFGEDKVLDVIGAYNAAKHFNLFTDSDVEDNLKPLREEIAALKEELKEA